MTESEGARLMGQRVEVHYASSPSSIRGTGTVVGYFDRPTVMVQYDNEHQEPWMAHLVTPVARPRIPEPGTWGVVEAACVHDATRRQWVHGSDGHWHAVTPYGEAAGQNLPDDWDSLRDPVLIHEGMPQ